MALIVDYMRNPRWLGNRVVISGRSKDFVELGLKEVTERAPADIKILYHHKEKDFIKQLNYYYYSPVYPKLILCWQGYKGDKFDWDKYPNLGFILTADKIYRTGRERWMKDSQCLYLDCNPFTEKGLNKFLELMNIVDYDPFYKLCSEADLTRLYTYRKILGNTEPWRKHKVSNLIHASLTPMDKVLIDWGLNSCYNPYSLFKRTRETIAKHLELRLIIDQKNSLKPNEIAEIINVPLYQLEIYKRRAKKLNQNEWVRLLIILAQMQEEIWGANLNSARAAITNLLTDKIAAPTY